MDFYAFNIPPHIILFSLSIYSSLYKVSPNEHVCMHFVVKFRKLYIFICRMFIMCIKILMKYIIIINRGLLLWGKEDEEGVLNMFAALCVKIV